MTGPVSGVVLAAGLSTRFEAGAGKPKQLFRVGGESLVRRTCRAALTSALGEVILVTGYATGRVRSEVSDLDLRTVHNPSYAEGQSGSVRCGLVTVADDAEGAMFLPIDQPGLDAGIIDRLLGAFGGPGSIVVPTFRCRRGAPATFGRDWFARLEGLRGDEGARPLLREVAPRVNEVELDSELPLVDIDTEAEARAWVERSGTP
jgi:molybdenum cofactor cytidylyltransferase